MIYIVQDLSEPSEFVPAGTNIGDVLTWDGTQWVSGSNDAIIGNEIKDVNNGYGALTRSGSGTEVDPYKLNFIAGVNVGDSLVWDGNKWVSQAAADADSVIGNEIVDVKNGFNLISRVGAGTSGDPYKLDVLNGGTSGNVLTWNGTQWVSSPLAVSGGDKETFCWIMAPSTNSTVHNLPLASWATVGGIMPVLVSNVASHYLRLTVPVPNDATLLKFLYWEITAGTLSATGAWSFSGYSLVPGATGYVNGGTITYGAPSYPVTNQLLRYNMLSLFTPAVLAAVAGGYLSVEMRCNGVSGMNNRNLGLRLIYS